MIVKYEGTNKLRAIQALRMVSDMGLKQAKDAIENPYGMEMEMRVYGVLVAVYLEEAFTQVGRLDFRIEDCPPSPTKVTLG